MAETTITALPSATTPLDGTERVPMDQDAVTRDASTQDIADLAGPAITAAVAAHEGAADPHPAYLTAAEGNAAYATAAQGALADSAQQPPAEGAFVDGDKTKLDGIEAGADVTDTANVTAAGALMDSEVTNLAQVKAFNSADYATAAQGALADSATQPADIALMVESDVTGITGADAVTNVVSLTQAEYDAIGVKDAATIYHITDDPGDLGYAAICIAASDETTNLAPGTAVVTYRMPFALTLSEVRASVNTAPVGSTIEVDINEGGVSLLSTILSIDASEKTSETAATPAVISDSALADDAEITIDIDQVGASTAGTGLKVWLIGVRA